MLRWKAADAKILAAVDAAKILAADAPQEQVDKELLQHLGNAGKLRSENELGILVTFGEHIQVRDDLILFFPHFNQFPNS